MLDMLRRGEVGWANHVRTCAPIGHLHWSKLPPSTRLSNLGLADSSVASSYLPHGDHFTEGTVERGIFAILSSTFTHYQAGDVAHQSLAIDSMNLSP